MLFRWRFWTCFKLLLRKRPVPSPRLPYEFAKLLSSRDLATLKQLATGLTARGEIRSGKLKA
jgi:hypothetical protein